MEILLCNLSASTGKCCLEPPAASTLLAGETLLTTFTRHSRCTQLLALLCRFVLMLIHRPAAVIGGGRVGRAICNLTHPAPPVYSRNVHIPRDIQGPIWVCTTNDALEDVLQRVHPSQHKQLVLIQNGMLLPWLAERGLQHITQVLLYMSVGNDGTITDGGRTATCGPLSSHVQHVLQQGGICCTVMNDWEQYNSAMVVKLLWSCIFWLLSAALGGIKVGQVAEHHSSAVEELVVELLPIAQYCVSRIQQHSNYSDSPTAACSTSSGRSQEGSEWHQGLQEHPAGLVIVASTEQQQQQDSFAPYQSDSNSGTNLLQDPRAVLEQLNLYSLAISAAVPSAEMARREFAWRNGWFLQQKLTDKHVGWLRQAGCGDLLTAYGIQQL